MTNEHGGAPGKRWGESVKDFICKMYQKKNFGRRLAAVLLALTGMGFAISWLVLVDLGTDPCTGLNLALAAKLGMSVGNVQALVNCILFVFVIAFGRCYIGFGTLANMFVVGYSLDFFSRLWAKVLPEGLFDSMAVRVVVLFPAITIFVVAAAVYMVAEIGTAPYDAIPLILAKSQSRIPFRAVRIGYDFFVILLGLMFGARIGAVTILMALTLGPVITVVGSRLHDFFER
ncbi:MAG: YczE/YyaS/YitT family protein [Roseburia sp.]